jgi:hypothetical protein
VLTSFEAVTFDYLLSLSLFKLFRSVLVLLAVELYLKVAGGHCTDFLMFLSDLFEQTFVKPMVYYTDDDP